MKFQLQGLETLALSVLLALCLAPPSAAGGDGPGPSFFGIEIVPEPEIEPEPEAMEKTAQPDALEPASPAEMLSAPAPDLARTAQTVAMFAVISLAPVAALMATAFVRIQVVLLLLRQALGSPQVPGNQVLTALALLLTALVMAPAGETVYREAIQPFASGEIAAEAAWEVGSTPIKRFMLEQIQRTNHDRYLVALYDYAEPPAPGRVLPTDAMDLPLRVVAPAFLLSELTTAFWIGFLIYLPFLVIDLVVSAVLAAMGLIMLPPAQISLPLKLVLFVLADGWWLVAESLLRTFALGPG
ncbi:flagellar type III secretion system pore protein FliP [soil metagenome]